MPFVKLTETSKVISDENRVRGVTGVQGLKVEQLLHKVQPVEIGNIWIMTISNEIVFHYYIL